MIKKSYLYLLTTFIIIFINSAFLECYAYNIPTIGYKGDTKKAEVIINSNVVITLKTSVAKKNPLQRAKQIAKELYEALIKGELRADRVSVALSKGEYIGRINKRTIFTADKESAKLEKTSRPMLALKWAANIRSALGGTPYNGVVNRSKNANTSYFSNNFVGLASWYGKKFNGRQTSSGEKYDIRNLTAAHRFLPFGTMILVTNIDNGKNVVVRVTDRGPFKDSVALKKKTAKNKMVKSNIKGTKDKKKTTKITKTAKLNKPNNKSYKITLNKTKIKQKKRIIDLSPAAFNQIGNLRSGLLRIRLDVLN